MYEKSMITGRVETPRHFSQLGILVVDGSGSMTAKTAGNITKAQATNIAIRQLFTRFKASKSARNFSFGVVTFDTKSTVILPPTEVGPALDDNADYDPLKGHGNGTEIFAALEEAGRIANDFLGQAPVGGVPHSVVILLMTDGCCSDPDRTRKAAAQIAAGPNGTRIRTFAAFFGGLGEGDAEGERLLQSIVSDPVMGFKTVYDAETLRGFFEASMSAASGGI